VRGSVQKAVAFVTKISLHSNDSLAPYEPWLFGGDALCVSSLTPESFFFSLAPCLFQRGRLDPLRQGEQRERFDLVVDLSGENTVSRSVKQKILMCPPTYYGVDYVINPWMEGQHGKTDIALAQKQWDALREKLAAHAQIEIVPAQPGLPDMVFTANAGLVWDGVVVVSRFRNKERQGEEPFFYDWFAANGLRCAEWPQTVPFEGAGDALWDRALPLLWIGSGFRSDVNAPPRLEKIFGRRVVQMKLVDPRFYHLDTCMCPLAGGYLMYFPAAFAPESLALIEELVPQDKRIVVAEEDAAQFACNTVELGDQVFMNGASDALQAKLRAAGFNPNPTPLSEFLKAGGTAKCLTLKLVEPLV